MLLKKMLHCYPCFSLDLFLFKLCTPPTHDQRLALSPFILVTMFLLVYTAKTKFYQSTQFSYITVRFLSLYYRSFSFPEKLRSLGCFPLGFYSFLVPGIHCLSFLCFKPCTLFSDPLTWKRFPIIMPISYLNWAVVLLGSYLNSSNPT